MRTVRTVIADSVHSYCGTVRKLLRAVRTVTADRSNEQMSRKYVSAPRTTVTHNQNHSFAMGLTDLAAPLRETNTMQSI